MQQFPSDVSCPIDYVATLPIFLFFCLCKQAWFH